MFLGALCPVREAAEARLALGINFSSAHHRGPALQHGHLGNGSSPPLGPVPPAEDLTSCKTPEDRE